MTRSGIKIILLSIVLYIITLSAVTASEIDLTVLVRNALENNADIAAAGYDISAERFKYESVKAGALPGLGFSSDTGNNPLYRYSDADEYSAETFTSERYRRHKFGGGLNVGAALPTGGSLSLTGAGNIELALADTDSAEWSYLVNPAVSLYMRQPLFTDRINGYPLRFDSLKLADELAAIGVANAELNSTALENSLILLITRTSAVLNSFRNSYSLLNSRIALLEKRLELALQDERAGRLSSLDRLSEELQIRRLQEQMIEIAYQIENTENDLEQLSGGGFSVDGYINLSAIDLEQVMQIDIERSFDVRSTAAAVRSLELAGTAVQNGSEPALEVSALYRRADSDVSGALNEAFESAGSAEMNLSVSMSVSFPLIDWGEMKKARESERQSLRAADERLVSSRQNAKLAAAAAFNNLKLLEEKILLLGKGLEYDRTLLEREQVRLDTGLSSEAAVETIKLDLLEREYSIKQLQDEKALAVLELYNTGGSALKAIFSGE